MHNVKDLLANFPQARPAAILFDLDGTLVDSVPDIAAAVDAAMNEHDFPVPGEMKVRNWIGNGAQKLVQRALAWAQSVEGLPIEEEQVAPELLTDVYQSFLHHYQESNGSASSLLPGAKLALEHWQAQGVPMAIVTNKPIQFVPALLQSLAIAHHFDLLLGGECVAEKKPAPTMLMVACQRLGVTPAHCLMVGDSGNDVYSAQAVPMPVVGVRGGYNHGGVIDEANPDLVLNSLEELIPA